MTICMTCRGTGKVWVHSASTGEYERDACLDCDQPLGAAMGNFLKNVTKGKLKKPFTVLVYGVDGVGKTTFAAGAPNPIFIGQEHGSNNLDVSRGRAPKDFDEIVADLKELRDDQHDYKTVVLDSLDWMEP